LDYQTSVEADRSTQRRVLTAIIDYCNAAGGKIVTVHSRRAADDVVDAFGERFRGKYILHWYSGGVRTLRRAVGNGAYICQEATGAPIDVMEYASVRDGRFAEM
jgi:TatD DNase family protein